MSDEILARETDCSNLVKEKVALSTDSMDQTDTSFDNSSILSAQSDISGEISPYSDLFEGTFYRTHTSESKLSIDFISSVFFEAFKNKIHADFMNSIDIDNTTFVSQCTTHIRGAKCEIKLDSHFKSVELSGIGHKAWREERFPRIVQSSLRRLIQGLDSILEDPSQNVSDSNISPDVSHEQKNKICNQTILDENDVNGGGAPKHNVAQLNVATTSTTEAAHDVKTRDEPQDDTVNQPESVPVPQRSFADSSGMFTAENITSQYRHSVNMAACTGENLSQTLENHVTLPPKSSLNPEFQDQCPDSAKEPAFTSTPIVQRLNGTFSNTTTNEVISLMMNRIEKLETGIRAIQRDVIRHMENKLSELKSSLINTIESLHQKSTYAHVAKGQTSTPAEEQPLIEVNQRALNSCYIDEGYDDQSGTSTPSSQTIPKTLFTPDNRSGVHQPTTPTTRQPAHHVTTPQPVPVRVTNRSQPQQRAQQHGILNRNRQNRSRTLLIGDSILKGINSRGLKTDVKICSRSGASINDMLNEISIYDMNSFANIIICIGGNDCSRGMDAKSFEDKYDQLIGIIRSKNTDCNIYISKIVPRGDTDVSAFNRSITCVVDHWEALRVWCIDGSYDLFFGQNQLPSTRYFTEDGIHLSYSGTKRLLDAWNRHVPIVEDFGFCVFKSKYQKTSRPEGSTGNYHHNRSTYRRSRQGYQGQRRGNTRRCYGCSMPGHILEECWHTQ